MRRYSPLAFDHPPAGDRFCAAKVLLQKRKTPMWVSFFFGAGDEARLATGIPRMAVAIRRSPAGPLDLTRFAPVEAASSSLPATFQKENTILTDGVSSWSGRRGSNSLPRPWQGRALPDELRPQTAPLLQRLWCLRPGSNRRHADFQSAALPTELPRQIGDQEGARTLDLQRDRLAF